MKLLDSGFGSGELPVVSENTVAKSHDLESSHRAAMDEPKPATRAPSAGKRSWPSARDSCFVKIPICNARQTAASFVASLGLPGKSPFNFSLVVATDSYYSQPDGLHRNVGQNAE